MSALNSYGGSTELTFDATGFFGTAQDDEGRWWFVDPSGGAFLSVGVAHADDSDLKYPHNLAVWQGRYGGSKERWIREGVVADLKDWGFNTIGWTQDYIGGGWRHEFSWDERVTVQQSASQFSPADFKVADMPYVILLRVAETEDWNGDPVFPDVFEVDFEDHCAYLARSVCVDLADDPNLIGYSYCDAPSWAPHVSGADFPQLLGLSPSERAERVEEIARKYYSTMERHIRAYDKNHLILGDLYNGNRPLPAGVLEGARDHIDVVQVQYFPKDTDESRQEMLEHARWASEQAAKPLLIPDIGNWTATTLNPNRAQAGMPDHAARAQNYIDSIETVVREPWFLGLHWCAYIENTARGWGIKDPWDEPYTDFVDPVRRYNATIYDRHGS